MATPEHLPSDLANAASGVDRVAKELAAAATRLTAAVGLAALTWSGPVSSSWTRSCLGASRDLLSQGRLAQALADTLRRAAQSAAQRIYWEQQAELARQKAEAAARAKAQKQR